MAKLLSILLQRNDTSVPWGFDIAERHHRQQPVVVCRVFPKAVATHHVDLGDVILDIEGHKTSEMTHQEVKHAINQPLTELRLILLKNGITKSQLKPYQPPIRVVKPVQNAAPSQRLKPDVSQTQPQITCTQPPRKFIYKPEKFFQTKEAPKLFSFSKLTQESLPGKFTANNCIRKTKNYFEKMGSKEDEQPIFEKPKRKIMDKLLRYADTDADVLKSELALPTDYYKSLSRNSTNTWSCSIDNLSNTSSLEYPKVFSMYEKTEDKSGLSISRIGNNHENFKSYASAESGKQQTSENILRFKTSNDSSNYSQEMQKPSRICRSMSDMSLFRTKPTDCPPFPKLNSMKYYNNHLLRNQFQTMNPDGKLLPTYPEDDVELIEYCELNTHEYDLNVQKTNCDVIMTECLSSDEKTTILNSKYGVNAFNNNETFTNGYKPFNNYGEIPRNLINLQSTTGKTELRKIETANGNVVHNETRKNFSSKMYDDKSVNGNGRLMLDKHEAYRRVASVNGNDLQNELQQNYINEEYQYPNNNSYNQDRSKRQFRGVYSGHTSDGCSYSDSTDSEDTKIAGQQVKIAIPQVFSEPIRSLGNPISKGIYRNNIQIEIGSGKTVMHTEDDGHRFGDVYNYVRDSSSDGYENYYPYSDLQMSASMGDLNGSRTIAFDYHPDDCSWTTSSTSRQQSNPSSPTSGEEGYSTPTSFPAAPPPPPPPGLVNLPSKRLSTEIPDRRLEPPACVQNAMMTKDKKPFTYTPGGLDLSQIKSPRMARRINRNAHAEGVSEVPRPSPLAQPPGQLPPSALAAMQPQLPIQVLPAQGMPIQPPPPPPPFNGSAIPPPPPPMNSGPPPPPPTNVNKPTPPIQNYQRPDIKIPPNPTTLLRQTHGPNRRVAPQNEEIDIPKQEQPEPLHTMKATNKPQLGSLYIPPITMQEMDDPRQTPKNTQTPTVRSVQSPPAAQSPIANLNKAPTPWLTQRAQPQQTVPAWAQRDETDNCSPVPIQHVQSPTSNNVRSPQANVKIIPISAPTGAVKTAIASPPPHMQSQLPPANQGSGWVIPIQIEYREQEPRPRQPQTPSHVSVQRQQSQHKEQQNYQQQRQETSTRIIPIQVEGAANNTQASKQQQQQQQPRQVQPVYVHNKFNNQPANVTTPNESWTTNGNYGQFADQMRMQLENDDQSLMNRFKNQVSEEKLANHEENPRYRGGHIPSRVFKLLDESVDEDTFLHTETDPRYRGAAIPSRAFRMLQTMTDTASGPMPQFSPVPRGPAGGRVVQIRTTSQPQQEDVGEHAYVPASEQQVPEPRKYTGSAIPSRSFRILQAMTSANNPNCASTPTPTENLENYANDPYFAQWGGYDPNYPPHPYWNNPYWGYYDPQQCYTPQPSSDSLESIDQAESAQNMDENTAQQYQQYWDPYGYYGYYGYPYQAMYSPSPYYYPNQNSDTDTDPAGYSSNDEMAFYGARFARQYPQNNTSNQGPKIVVTPVNDVPADDIKRKETSTPEESNANDSDTSDSDTDTEHDDPNQNKSGSLLAIKSVSDINVYSNDTTSICSESTDHPSDGEDSNDDSTEEIDDTSSLCNYIEDEIPHQLSVIFEEAEVSDIEQIKHKHRNDSVATTISEDDSSTTIGRNEYDSEGEELSAESTVTVKLPLKLKFSRTENNEAITTILVEPSKEVVETHFTLKSPSPRKETRKSPKNHNDGNVSVTVNIPSQGSFHKRGDSEIDSHQSNINGLSPTTTDDFMYETAESDSEVSVNVSLSLKKPVNTDNNDIAEKLSSSNEGTVEDDSHQTSDEDTESDDSSSASSDDSSSASSSDSEEEEEPQDEKDDDCNEIEKLKDHFAENMKTIIKEKVEKNQALHCVDILKGIKRTYSDQDTGKAVSVKQRISSFEKGHNLNTKPVVNKTTVRRNSSKSTDISDEEVDSGVTSDMSRQISETDTESECFTELRKLTRYQRAATHSRLFKLLQDECGNKSDEEEESNGNDFDAAHKPQEIPQNLVTRKESLTLPLRTKSSHECDSLSSSDLTSPSSPTINDRLVKELVQSLLRRKKGRCLRHLPIEKLHAAAIRILQEDMDRCDTISSSEDGGSTFLSPMHTETMSSSPIQTPQDFYSNNTDDYSDYYNTWARAGKGYTEEYDILPSRTFKLLQEHAGGNNPTAMNGLLAKCPRVLSAKNLHNELQRVTETRETPSPLSESTPMVTSEARTT